MRYTELHTNVPNGQFEGRGCKQTAKRDEVSSNMKRGSIDTNLVENSTKGLPLFHFLCLDLFPNGLWQRDHSTITELRSGDVQQIKGAALLSGDVQQIKGVALLSGDVQQIKGVEL